MGRLGRPPSPPEEENGSGTTKSSPTFSTSSVLTPPDSPHPSLSVSPPPFTSPLPPLSPELFRLTLAFLAPSQRECESLLLVSHAWYNFITTQPQLWTHLHFRLDREDHIARARIIAARASVNGGGGNSRRGGIRSLAMSLSGRREDAIEPQTAVLRLGQLVDELFSACIPSSSYDAFGRPLGHHSASTLVQLQVNLEPPSAAAMHVLGSLADLSCDLLFSNVRSLELRAALPNFLVMSNFFSVWPALSSLRISGPPQPTVATKQESYTWAGEHHQPIATSHLRQLVLQGATIRDLALPAFPFLTYLSLQNVSWEGRTFFLLLRMCRKTLITLECIDLEMVEVEGGELEDWQLFVDVREPSLVDGHFFNDMDDLEDDELIDEVAPIIFPFLKHLHLSHEVTPPFFASLEYADFIVEGEPSYPTPNFVMPALTRAIMDDISVESDADDGDGPLAVFGRNAPNLMAFDLTSSLANDQSIFACLAGMQGCLRSLTLTDTNVTDRLLVHLPGLTPRLERLDVRRCDVTIQGVARLVEVSRDNGFPPDALGPARLHWVRVDPPRWSDAEFVAYRWLAYLGFLVRDEWDFESEGPRGVEDRRRWIKAGKLDLEKEEQRRRREERRREDERKQQAAIAAQRQVFPHVPSLPPQANRQHAFAPPPPPHPRPFPSAP